MYAGTALDRQHVIGSDLASLQPARHSLARHADCLSESDLIAVPGAERAQLGQGFGLLVCHGLRLRFGAQNILLSETRLQPIATLFVARA